ncbi:MAG: flavodoxin-dependent (E)-4-hydroxy-3-methylbut-2-enyl-diphosphate synthase [Syntrophomonadaceae bacterium]|nr:flavodoxin-dependent (E)-4-hydroxy-3-methylbut-2-enyl-diphosphate synthase [Syntrophomonadaceae bacterium]
MRRRSKIVKLGGVCIGGDNPVVVQSMTTTDTRNVEATVRQIHRLEEAGCEVIRVAVVDEDAARAIRSIRSRINIPLVADIHFDHRLALLSLEAGADGLRINPGNIGGRVKVREVVAAAQDRGVPIRIGVNAGSLERSLLEKYGKPCPEAMVESALGHVAILEDLGFANIKVSLKASSLQLTLDSYRLMAQKVDYPLHLGVTEAGTLERGLIKSALGIGLLLYEGIGDTIRVSLTADPVYEVWAGFQILKVLGLRDCGAELISCPTCGRTEIDIIRIAEEVDKRLMTVKEPVKVAVMGCVVNGPGEAREADIGIAGGRGFGLLFKKGEIVRKVEEGKLVDTLIEEIDKILQGGKDSQ